MLPLTQLFLSWAAGMTPLPRSSACVTELVVGPRRNEVAGLLGINVLRRWAGAHAPYSGRERVARCRDVRASSATFTTGLERQTTHNNPLHFACQAGLVAVWRSLPSVCICPRRHPVALLQV
jgi:hypothetical protein